MLFAVHIMVKIKEVYSMPRKGENIYKRKDGRWEGRFIKGRTSTGKAIYGYIYSKTYHEAKELLIRTAAENNKSNSIVFTSDRIKFRTLAQEWLDKTKVDIKESTKNKYRNLLNSYILPDIGELVISQLTSELIQQHCSQLLIHGGTNKTGLSSKTVADVLSLIRSILKYATQKGISVHCDTSIIHIKQEKKEMRVLSPLEQKKLCQYLCSNQNPCNLGILVSMFTGLRIGEICALRWNDISLPEQTIYVHYTLQRIQDPSDSTHKTKVLITAPKSSCSIRIIPIPDDLVTILRKSAPNTNAYLLTNTSHYMEPRTLQNRFKKVLAECGLAPINYHVLRHTFATRCVELGFDIKSLSELLGHANITITMNRYVHPSMALKKENMQRLSPFISVK